MSHPSHYVELSINVDPRKIGNQRIVPDRVQPVVELVCNRRVLNIGCCGSDVLHVKETVHRKIAMASSYCIGIDIFEEGIKKMQEDGENVICANAEKFNLEDKDFDVVVLGDVIEHVSNPGLVFENSNKHLKMGGDLIVITPTPFSLPLMTQIIRRGNYYVNSEHTMWFDPVLLSFLLKRFGFEPVEVFYTGRSEKFLYKIAQLFRKDLNQTFGIVARKIENIQ